MVDVKLSEMKSSNKKSPNKCYGCFGASMNDCEFCQYKNYADKKSTENRH